VLLSDGFSWQAQLGPSCHEWLKRGVNAMTDSIYKAIDILNAKASIQEIQQRYVIIWDPGKGENLIQVINMMASEGWIVRQCWGLIVSFTGPCQFSLLEKTSQSERF